MPKNDLHKIVKLMNDRDYYEPHPSQIRSAIASCEPDEMNILLGVYRPIQNYNLDYKQMTNYPKILWANHALGLLLLIYDKEHDLSIEMLLDRGARLVAQDISLLIAISERISNHILLRLLNSFNDDLNSPIVNELNLLTFLSLQRCINKPLIDFLVSKVSPDNEYDKNTPGVTGITVAIENYNFPLVNYYVQLGFKVDLKDYYGLAVNKHSIQPTEDEFENEVKKFKQLYDIKSLRRWLSVKNKRTAPNHALFLANSTIGNYLRRTNIKILQQIPVYSKHEKSFYIGSKTLFKIPFRTDKSTLSLAEANDNKRKNNNMGEEEGTSDIANELMFSKLKDELPKATRFILIRPKDIYDLSEQLELYKKIKSRDYRFIYIFSVCSKDNHAFSVLSCLDTEKETIPFHLIVNSWEDAKYIRYLTTRINLEQQHNNAGIADVFEASVPVQVYENDVYCVSDAIELTRALYLSLSSLNSTLLTDLDNFAGCNDRKSDWIFLNKTIQKEIQLRLPMFFNQTTNGFSLKTEDEIINWHIQNRINYGSNYIALLQTKAEKIITENTMSIQQIQLKL